MANYLDQSGDFIPEIAVFQPDMDFLNQALSTKQARYDSGYDQLSKMYGSLLYSPLAHDESIRRRDDFFKKIDDDIKKVSALDFSKRENVELAGKVFDPIINDKYIIKDMAFVKSAQKAMEEADYYKNCMDSAKCGDKYWEGGVRAIHYQLDDFSKSRYSDILGFQNPTYVKGRNISKEALKFAKDMGFQMENLTFDPSGRYRIKTTNGVAAIPALSDVFLSTFGNDQGAIEYYKTQAYLNRKDYIAANASMVGEQKAEEMYFDSVLKSIPAIADQLIQEQSIKLNQADTSEKAVGSLLKTMDPETRTAKELAEALSQLTQDKKVLESNVNFYDKTKGLVNQELISSMDPKSLRMRIDSSVGNMLLSTDLVKSAQNYAQLTQKIDLLFLPKCLS